MTTQQNKQKYDLSKPINLITNVENYNDIGTKDCESADKISNGYKTRQTGNQNQEKPENTTIDKKVV